MRITRTVAAVGVAGAMALTGVGMAVAAPAGSGTEEQSDGVVAALREALEELVGDGTLTDEQADAVAGSLAGSDAVRHRRGEHGGHGGHGAPGGHGGHGLGRLVDPDVAASTLGLSADELRTALSADGATLAGVAEDQGVEAQVLIDALVAAATERVEQAVTDGRLTRDDADARIAELPERIATVVAEELRFGHGHGRGGRGAPGDDATPDDPGADDGTTEDGTSDDAATGTRGPFRAPQVGVTT